MMSIVKGYNGYLVLNKNELLGLFPPKFKSVICHHVTHEFGIVEQMPPKVDSIKIVAHVYNDVIQAMVVSVDNSVDRPDGGVYHITWSLDKENAKPAHSNKLIENEPWHSINNVDVEFEPKFFRFK